MTFLVKQGENGTKASNRYGNLVAFEKLSIVGVDHGLLMEADYSTGTRAVGLYLTPADAHMLAESLLTMVAQRCPDGIPGKRYRQHPACEIPLFLQREGWSDNSWRNDTCANSLFEFDEKTQEALRVWVTEENRAEREYPQGPRYTVEHIRSEAEHLNGEAVVLYEGEDAAAAEEAVRQFMAARA